MSLRSKIRRGRGGRRFFPRLNYAVLIAVAVWLVVLGLILGVAQMVYHWDAFIVREVELTPGVDKSIVTALRGRSLFAIDARALRRKVMAGDSNIKDVIVTKQFPSRLVVEAVKRRPLLQVKCNGFLLIDHDGVITDRLSEPDARLVTIEIDDCTPAAQKGMSLSSPELKLAITLLREFERRHFVRHYAVDSINAAAPASLYFMIKNRNPADGSVQVIIGDRDFTRRLFIFENLMATKIKGDMALVKYIDLRYCSEIKEDLRRGNRSGYQPTRAYIGYKK